MPGPNLAKLSQTPHSRFSATRYAVLMLPALLHPVFVHPVTGLIPWLDPKNLIEGFGVWALVVVCAFVFAETGLLVGFVLPGDTLLVISGVLAFPGAKQVIHIDIWWVCLAISAAAFLGGEAGYLIGRKAGPRVFERKESGFFSRRNVERTNALLHSLRRPRGDRRAVRAHRAHLRPGRRGRRPHAVPPLLALQRDRRADLGLAA